MSMAGSHHIHVCMSSASPSASRLSLLVRSILGVVFCPIRCLFVRLLQNLFSHFSVPQHRREYLLFRLQYIQYSDCPGKERAKKIRKTVKIS